MDQNPFDPRDVRNACLALHLQRAARVVTRGYDAGLRDLGLSLGQFSILVSLMRAEPPGLGGLAAELAMDRTTLTANLKPLMRRGWVRAEVDPEDARGRRLVLTDPGRAVVAQALPRWQAAQAAALAGVADADRLRADLRALAWPER